jgi:hypothetical protein
MKRILLVRLSSLGDVLHTFPAATDIRRALPEAVVDWAVEEAYAAIGRIQAPARNTVRAGAGGSSGSGRKHGASSRLSGRAARAPATRSTRKG